MIKEHQVCQPGMGLQNSPPSFCKILSTLKAEMCLELEGNMFLVPPVVPQTKVAISSSLKAQKSYTQKRTEKAALPGGEVAPPPLPQFISAVSRMVPRHGGSSSLCQREAALQKTSCQFQPFQKKKEKLLWDCCHGSNETLKEVIIIIH